MIQYTDFPRGSASVIFKSRYNNIFKFSKRVRLSTWLLIFKKYRGIFRSAELCALKRKSMIENFLAYIKSERIRKIFPVGTGRKR